MKMFSLLADILDQSATFSFTVQAKDCEAIRQKIYEPLVYSKHFCDRLWKSQNQERNCKQWQNLIPNVENSE